MKRNHSARTTDKNLPTHQSGLTDSGVTECWHTGNIRKVETPENKTGSKEFRIYYDTPETEQKLWGEGAYKNGKKVGCWKTYYFNGQLETFWKYKNGVIQDGTYPFYDETGKEIGKNEYRNHKLYNGTVLLHWPDGSIRECYTIVNYKKSTKG